MTREVDLMYSRVAESLISIEVLSSRVSDVARAQI